MVSVRRRGAGAPLTSTRTKIGNTFSAAGGSSQQYHAIGGGSGRSSPCVGIFRTILLAFIALQGLTLTVRILHRISSSPPLSSSTTSSSLDLSHSTSSTSQQNSRNTHSLLRPDPQLPGDSKSDGGVSRLKSVKQGPPGETTRKAKDDVTDADDGAHGVGWVEKDNGQFDDHKVDKVPDEEEEAAEHEEPQEDEQSEPKDAAVVSVIVDGSTSTKQTGATPLAYVMDLVQLRSHPDFRRHSPTFLSPRTSEETSQKLQHLSQLAGGIPLKACDYVEKSSPSHPPRFLQRATCRDPSTHQYLWAYNPASFPRYWCGKEIPSKGVLQFQKDIKCQEPVHVFSTQQPWHGGDSIVGVPPIVVKAYNNTNNNHKPVLEAVDCNVPCQFEQGLPTKGERTIDGTDWKLIVNDADPFLDEMAKPELTAFKRDEYYSTMSLRSSIPLSHYSFELYNLRQTRALDWSKVDNAATYLIDTNCNPYGLRRQKWYAAMAAGFTTRSYGKCDHNTDLGPGETVATMEGRIALAQKNRIHLAFEATGEKDYATSIVWESLLSGAVPAILGARNAREFLPKHSAILASNFNDWDKYAAHVKNISETKELWDSYHAWRTDELALQEFEARFNFTRTTPQCRTCRWAYSKQHGLGWNHQQQDIIETHIPRRLCRDSKSHLVLQPFREVWGQRSTASSVPTETSTGKGECPTTEEVSVATIEQDGFKVERSVMQHDGVVDLVIQSVEATAAMQSDVVVRLHVKVRNLEGSYFSHTHSLVATSQRGSLISSAAIQDEKAKVTVLASWETQIHSPSQGVVEVVVLHRGDQLLADETRRIRIIAEDFSLIHDKLTEYFPSSFAKQMTIDFVDPVEMFYPDS